MLQFAATGRQAGRQAGREREREIYTTHGLVRPAMRWGSSVLPVMVKRWQGGLSTKRLSFPGGKPRPARWKCDGVVSDVAVCRLWYKPSKCV